MSHEAFVIGRSDLIVCSEQQPRAQSDSWSQMNAQTGDSLLWPVDNDQRRRMFRIPTILVGYSDEPPASS